jgi:hypothetical protein
MNTVEEKLKQIEAVFVSLSRNTVEGWFEFEIGIQANWVYQENNYIGCEVLEENSEGKLIKIYPKTDNITSDDLINFICIIISTNKRIAEKQEEFEKQMEQVKKELEKSTSKFYEELENLRNSSFIKATEDDKEI